MTVKRKKNPNKTKYIKARNPNQQLYIDSLNENIITIGSGDAGVGKTWLSIAVAIDHLLAGKVKKIILTRPAVEAGEKLGFLPGGLEDKMLPYLIPLFDALKDFISKEQLDKFMAEEVIEIAPLAYMRGRTLSNAFVILDEAQNTTTIQMKMFLTRLGEGSKMAVNGDPSQIDLPPKINSGLVEVLKKLNNTKDIGIIKFSEDDVVRHPLVTEILKKYKE